MTAVGGTSLAIGPKNGRLFEQGWGTGRSVLTGQVWAPNPPTFQYGGGGGTSRVFRQPNTNSMSCRRHRKLLRNGPHRAVPDIAMVGDPNTGFLIGQSQTSPDGGIKYSEYRVGGTSLSSPLLAGVMAVADQALGRGLGFLNPRLYRLAATDALSDIASQGVKDGVVRVDYKNGFNASAGVVTSLRTFNQTGSIYPRTGYDDATGIGTPNLSVMEPSPSASSATRPDSP